MSPACDDIWTKLAQIKHLLEDSPASSPQQSPALSPQLSPALSPQLSPALSPQPLAIDVRTNLHFHYLNFFKLYI